MSFGAIGSGVGAIIPAGRSCLAIARQHCRIRAHHHEYADRNRRVSDLCILAMVVSLVLIFVV